MKLFPIACLLLALAGSHAAALSAQTQNSSKAVITVDVDHPDHAVSPTLFGVFFEDINLSVDGGIYPEQVRNRSFEDADTLQHWTFEGVQGRSTASVTQADWTAREPLVPLNAFNRKFLLIRADGAFRLSNRGYWGMNLTEGDSYTFRAAVRMPGTDTYRGNLDVRLVAADGRVLAQGALQGFTADWQYFTLNMHPVGSDTDARLELSGQGRGRLFLDMVSLMPDKRWGTSGIRTDLAEAMAGLKPTFFRFPGGCWVEGDDLAHRYQWKNTIGDVDKRIPLWNIWDYNATHGLGYHEYLQLAEDLGAEPLFCINVGMSHKEAVPVEQLGQWIQDALDAIEYANGPVESVWGSIRAQNGHPEPFNLKYIEIGNENFGPDYKRNYERMAAAIRAKYPDMKLVVNDFFGTHPHTPRPDLVDEHYYNTPDWFIRNAYKYDTYDRSKPQIFVGEYAVTSGTGNGNLRGAIGEAAFMTGMERNSDVVAMAAYAPLFCHARHKRWPINLINFDNHRWYGIPSYYVQQMFARNQGTRNLPLTVSGAPMMDDANPRGRIGLGTWKNAAEFKDLRVTAPDGTVLYEGRFDQGIGDWEQTGKGDWSVEDGVLRQLSLEPEVTAFVGDTTWTAYTVTLKARKLHGENGFQIYFHHHANSGRIRWDVGGYDNSLNEMQTAFVSRSMDYALEAGRWYDVRLEVTPTSVHGYLDGQLVQEIPNTQLYGQTLFASAALDEKSGELIVKVVNTDARPLRADVLLNGSAQYESKARLTVLTSDSPLDENTPDNPTRVSPRQETAKVSGKKISHRFPGNSLTVIRVAKK